MPNNIQRYTITPPVEVVHSEDGYRVTAVVENQQDVSVATDPNGRWVTFDDHEKALKETLIAAGVTIADLREEVLELLDQISTPRLIGRVQTDPIKG